MKIFLFLPSLFLAGCRSAAPGYTPVPQANVPVVSTKVSSPEVLMPLDVGNQWSYALHTETTRVGEPIEREDTTIDFRVEKSTGTQALLVLENEGKVVERQDWTVDARGIYQGSAGVNRVPYSPPQPLALLPLDAGRTFEWKGRGMLGNGEVAEGRASCTVRAAETVDTGRGPMSAIPVSTRTTFAKGNCDNTSWYRPGIGLVRVRQTATDVKAGVQTVMILTLNNYALKSQPTL